MKTPREISHTLEILVPPRIHFVSNDGKYEVKKGSTVTLECKASGNPVPFISWSRKNNLLPSGEKSVEGLSITIEHATRNQAGIYECTADNKVGSPVTKEIVLNVLYPPEIEVERNWVHSGEGYEAHLVCLVHAEPPAEVLWFRNTLRLDTTDNRITEARGNRHTLILRKVKSTDFGNYSCLADNSLGKTRQYVELSGKPNPAEFRSGPLSSYRDSYNISWSVISYTNVEEYKLYYRKLPVSELQPSPRQQQSKHSEVDNDTYGGVHGGRNHLGDGRGHMGMGYGVNSRGAMMAYDWHMVIVQADPSGVMPSSSLLASNKGHNGQSHGTVHWGSLMLKELEPASDYEAKVQARNRFGWSEASKRFTFSTRGFENSLIEPSPVPAVFSEPEVRDLGMTAASSGGSANRGAAAAVVIKPPTEYIAALVIISLMVWT
ncbi:neural cell adhesion molecule 1-like isoform X1 [Ischnura elegans]|uniref:neural cell adhesion molecule 1-like isoform X1 n=1 Tax=Ischnura elegans TaxID=197161 RepID=UPI001ED8886F|nr:neural cell adhesion molecule 1-like isoform X1 [Ischnura elegans]